MVFVEVSVVDLIGESVTEKKEERELWRINKEWIEIEKENGVVIGLRFS